MLNIGIIGYGTIGEDVAEGIRHGLAGQARLGALLVRDASRVDLADKLPETKVTDELESFLAQKPDIVVECAGHDAVRKYGVQVLDGGADLILVSVGALADEALFGQIKDKATERRRKVIVPSAAIGGLDRISAASVGPMEEVRITTRKPTKAWYGTYVEQEIDLATLTEPYCAYEGVAREAARLFPESVNVSAALSLAGIGFDATKVKVVADPGITHNIHEIEAKGKFGEMKLQIRNTPSARNPKTGYIVAMSVIKTLRDMTSPIVIGI